MDVGEFNLIDSKRFVIGWVERSQNPTINIDIGLLGITKA
jgi:hypothetical protein